MIDERLQRLLQEAFPATTVEPPPSDRWPKVVSRIQGRSAWSWRDVVLAALVVGLLLLFPRGWLMLAYHL